MRRPTKKAFYAALSPTLGIVVLAVAESDKIDWMLLIKFLCAAVQFLIAIREFRKGGQPESIETAGTAIVADGPSGDIRPA